MLEPRGEDFLRARAWLQGERAQGLRAADALHLAIAQRHRLTLVRADRTLITAARALAIPCQLVG